MRNICCGHKFCVRDTKNVSDFVQKHFVSATNVSQFAQPKKHHEQQCVRNNVSSFARVLRCNYLVLSPEALRVRESSHYKDTDMLTVLVHCTKQLVAHLLTKSKTKLAVHKVPKNLCSSLTRTYHATLKES